jgi:hypothetical protein
MSSAVSVLMIAHALEVIVWSMLYSIVDIAPVGADVVYFAFVNYTMLDYGNVVPQEHWRLLGPTTAMNGVLLFGWSTAAILRCFGEHSHSVLRYRALGPRAPYFSFEKRAILCVNFKGGDLVVRRCSRGTS